MSYETPRGADRGCGGAVWLRRAAMRTGGRPQKRSRIRVVRIVDDRLRIAASDVANFIACRHLTRLDLAAAHGLVRAPILDDLGAKALEERGLEHERQVLEGFRARGWSVDDHRRSGQDRGHESADATAAAMHRGADVIYQGTLLVDDRLGLPDFLIRAAI